MNHQLQFRLALVFLISFALTILPLPAVINNFRPSWVLLLTLYVQFYLPNHFKVSLLLFVGLCVDLLLSTLLGEHVFALVITTWLASSRVTRFHLFSLPQQMSIILLLSLSYEYLLYLIDAYQGFHHSMMMVLGSTLVNLILWLWLCMFLKQYFFIPTRHRSSTISI